MSVDYYETLGVARDADTGAIRKAYRALALRWHPDKHPASNKAEAEEKFKSIAEAFEVLSSAEKRAAYDNAGSAGEYSSPEAADESWSDSHADSFHRNNQHHGFRRSAHPFSRNHAFDIFNAFFGGQDPFAAMHAQMQSAFGGAGGFGMGMGMGSPFGGGGGMQMASPFGMMGMLGGGMQMGSPFGMMSPFGSMSLLGGGGGMGQHHRSQTDPFGGMSSSMSFGGMGGMSSGVSMSSSSYTDASGRTVTKTTRTTTENGQARTSTSTQIQHPDGRVETIQDSEQDQQQSLPSGGGHHARSLTSGAAASRSSPIDLRSPSVHAPPSPIDLRSPVMEEESSEGVEEIQAPPPRRAPRNNSNANGGRHAHSHSYAHSSRAQHPAAPAPFHRSESSDAAYSGAAPSQYGAPPQPQPHQRASSQPSYGQSRASPSSTTRASPRVGGGGGYSKGAASPGSGGGATTTGASRTASSTFAFPSSGGFEAGMSLGHVPPPITSVPRGVSGDYAARRADAAFENDLFPEHKRTMDARRTKL